MSTCQGPIITKLHFMHELKWIFEPIFEEDNCDKFRARQHNYKFVSLRIPNKSNKTIDYIYIYIYIKNMVGHMGIKSKNKKNEILKVKRYLNLTPEEYSIIIFSKILSII